MSTHLAAALFSITSLASSLLGCGDDASLGPDASLGDASDDPLRGRPAASAAHVRAASAVAWAADRGWVVLGSDARLIVVDPIGDREVVLATLDQPVRGLAVRADQLVVATADAVAGAPLVLRVYDLAGDLAAPRDVWSIGAISGEFGAPIPAPPLALIGPDQLILGGVVGVDLATGVHASAAGVPYTFVYDPARIDVRDGLLYTPSAYPGEVVVAALAAFPELTEVARLPVPDWIHNVTLLAGNRALVAGHLDGLAVVELDVEGGTVGAVTILDEGKRTYAEVVGGTAYAIAAEPFAPTGRLLCFAADDLTVREIALPAPADATATTPLEATFLSELTPGVARLFVRGVGLVDVRCPTA